MAEAEAQVENQTEETGAAETTETTASESPWYEGISHDGLKTAASEFKTEDEFFQSLGLEVSNDDWRDNIKDEKLKEHAKRFPTIEDAIKANLDSRKKLSSAITPPGTDAAPEEVEAYRKAIGVPEAPDAYEFPDLPEGMELTDGIKASREAWAQRFHDLSVPAATAKELAKLVAEDDLAVMEAQVQADKEYVERSESELKADWKGDFDRNTKAAERAILEFADKAGINTEDLRQMETKDGTFLLDHPVMRRLFASAGLEMMEGNLGPNLSESELSSAQGDLDNIRNQISEAQAKGNSKLANELYQKEMKLVAKIGGSQPIVGSSGRAA